MTNQSMFWADQIARDVKTMVQSRKELQAMVKKHGYFIYDEKTPSGKIHIGSGRGWIMHDIIAKAMRKIKLKAKFVLSFDDMDPYDKPNKDLGKDWNKYLGIPFVNLPSPEKGYTSYAEYYSRQATDKFDDFGIICDIESTAEQYRNGLFNKQIKIALDNSDKISQIFEDMYDKPYDRLPFTLICEKCGKIATTKATEWDPKTELLSYECRKDLVTYTTGCGHKGKISPYNGNGKFPWKIEWAAKWPAKGVICEYAGKDHFTKLGSRDVAIRIADKVFDSHIPYPSKIIEKNGNKIYIVGPGYEFFNIAGKKMSTSKGQGIGFAESTEFLPAHMIRYLLARARPNSVVDFDPFGRNDIILLYERFDKTERIYYKKDKVSDTEFNQAKRIYELSHVGKLPKQCPIQIHLAYAAIVLQVGLTVEGALQILKSTGHIPNKLTKLQTQEIVQRLREAKHWLDHIASDDFKFELQDKSTTKIATKEKKALKLVAKFLQSNPSQEDLHNKFYDICRDLELETKLFYRTAYKVLINRETGPKLAGFMKAIGKNKVKKLFMQL